MEARSQRPEWDAAVLRREGKAEEEPAECLVAEKAPISEQQYSTPVHVLHRFRSQILLWLEITL
jgi:hypothetical protein